MGDLVHVCPPEAFYQQFLSQLSINRTDDAIRALMPLESRPGLISLLVGKPNTSCFPIKSLSFSAQDPCDSSKEIPITLSPEELEVGLQYSPTTGIPNLVDWLYKLQEICHGRKRSEGWKLSVGNGCQDLMYKAVTSFINPGDSVFLEAPMYPGVIPMFQTIQCDIHEVETDANGMCSHKLRQMLENWPTSKPKPKILYTVPYGCNPTGMTVSLERRLEVLDLAHEHNFIILEDDPYYFVYYGKAPRPPSYFELEKQQGRIGRVIRFDSLSKVLSSGLRLGFASGPLPLMRAIDRHSTNANLQPNSMAQVLAISVLSRWGHEGFLAHTTRVAQFYREKRDIFEAALRRHLTGLVEWSSPESGFFIWFKLLLTEDGTDGCSEAAIRTHAFERGVLALPGTVFLPSGRKTAYARASFSQLEPDQVDEALRRLKEAILDARKTGCKE
ncbi:PLP-dependent transferase [Cristinia sonorae]|uniref:PLP-dependent transferase n=1 Tax=Cristinia sonorae TaxID=1940300 RepID=A0A8K0UR47_9AGAR|nr:PLP-dependent transferase [Cristinia sonorae]